LILPKVVEYTSKHVSIASWYEKVGWLLPYITTQLVKLAIVTAFSVLEGEVPPSTCFHCSADNGSFFLFDPVESHDSLSL